MKKEKWSGSATVEAAILMPIFLILLTTMLMFAMFVYEKSAMRSVCNHIAAEGAAIWERGEDYMRLYYQNNGVPQQESQDKVHIYHIYANYFSNLVDVEKGEKEELLRQYAIKEIVRHSFILTEKDVNVQVELSNIIVHKSLTVSAQAEYDLPFYKDKSQVTAICVISGQTELIRTVDLAADLLDGPMKEIKEKYGAVIDRLKELIQKVDMEQ